MKYAYGGDPLGVVPMQITEFLRRGVFVEIHSSIQLPRVLKETHCRDAYEKTSRE